MEHITPAFRSNRLLQGLVCWLIVLWIITAIEPFNRRDWFLENLLVFFYGTLLVLTISAAFGLSDQLSLEATQS